MSTSWAVSDGRASWSGRLLIEWVDDLVGEIVDLLDPLAVWLYGSVARGDDGPHSDIDLLVVLPSYDPAGSIELKRHVLDAVTAPVPFDLSFTDTARFAERSAIAGTIERSASRDGRIVYERRPADPITD